MSNGVVVYQNSLYAQLSTTIKQKLISIVLQYLFAVNLPTAGPSSNTFKIIVIVVGIFVAVVIIGAIVISFLVLYMKNAKKSPPDPIYELPDETGAEHFQMTRSDAYGITRLEEPHVMTTCSAYEL